MKSWKDIVAPRCAWDDLGYEHVDMDSIIGKPQIIEDFELYKTSTNEQGFGVRILFVDLEGKHTYTHTGGIVICNGFKENEAEVRDLIKNKVPITFKLAVAGNGHKYITME